MTHEEKTALRKAAKLIQNMSNNRKDGIELISEMLVRISINGAKQEREAWEKAVETLGPKTKEKLMKARYEND